MFLDYFLVMQLGTAAGGKVAFVARSWLGPSKPPLPLSHTPVGDSDQPLWPARRAKAAQKILSLGLSVPPFGGNQCQKYPKGARGCHIEVFRLLNLRKQGPSVRNMRNNTSSYPSRIAMKNRYFQLRNTLLCLCTLPKNWPMLTDFWANMQTCIAKMAVHLFCLQFHMT